MQFKSKIYHEGPDGVFWAQGSECTLTRQDLQRMPIETLNNFVGVDDEAKTSLKEVKKQKGSQTPTEEPSV